MMLLRLRNSSQFAIVDRVVYDQMLNDPYLSGLDLINRLRMHSSGYAFYQRNVKEDSKYKSETIYLHKWIAEHYIDDKPMEGVKSAVMILNGNPLDCRVDNLKWASMGEISRNTKKKENKNGYRGVHFAYGKYRAVIYDKGKRIDLGLFATADAAAEAYNNESKKLFGETKSLNAVPVD